jgi:hypothetical protein
MADCRRDGASGWNGNC